MCEECARLNDRIAYLEDALQAERMENSWLRTQLSLHTSPDEDIQMSRGDEDLQKDKRRG